MTVPVYLPYYVSAGTAGMMTVILLGLRSALRKARWPARKQAAAIGAVAATLGGWFLLTAALAWFDFYRAGAGQAPTLQYGIFIPLLIGGVLIWRSPQVAQIIDAVPQSWLIGVQLYRALGVIFLILYASGRLPGLFAWPAGLGDVLVGILAPVIAVAYARTPSKNADLVLAWNLFGLADLMVAVTMGFLTSPSPFQLFAFQMPSELVTQLPLVLVPVFLVPVSALLHLASLAKLRREATPDTSRREISGTLA